MNNQEKIGQILSELKKKPLDGATDLQTLIEKLKAFQAILKLRMEGGTLKPEHYKRIREDLHEAGLVPTFHEMILFFVVILFIVFVFGKTSTTTCDALD